MTNLNQAIEWRAKYANDQRMLAAVKLTNKGSRLAVATLMVGKPEDNEDDAPVLSTKTAKPLLYFPDEIRLLLNQLTRYAIGACEFPDSDLEVVEVIGVSLAYSTIAGAVPKIKFDMQKQVLAEGNYWKFSSPALYLKGVEGSLLALPDAVEDLVEQLRLHCLRAIDGEFDGSNRQLSLLDSVAEPGAVGEEIFADV